MHPKGTFGRLERSFGGSLLSIFLFLLFMSSAFAIDLDFAGQGGIGSSQISESAGSKNQISNFGLTGSVALNPFRFFAIGGRTDYRWIGQRSDAAIASGGNRKGTRFVPISPFVDLSFGSFRLRFDYQFQGEYKLTYKTLRGKSVSYGDPQGARGELHFCTIRGKERFYKIPGKCYVYSGVYYEKVKFGTENEGAVTRQLTKPLELTQAGLMIGVGF